MIPQERPSPYPRDASINLLRELMERYPTGEPFDPTELSANRAWDAALLRAMERVGLRPRFDRALFLTRPAVARIEAWLAWAVGRDAELRGLCLYHHKRGGYSVAEVLDRDRADELDAREMAVDRWPAPEFAWHFSHHPISGRFVVRHLLAWDVPTGAEGCAGTA
jgi:hypothetical protein